VVRLALPVRNKKKHWDIWGGSSSAENLGHLNVDHVHQQEKKTSAPKKYYSSANEKQPDVFVESHEMSTCMYV
jgi:hypothetical protein